MPAANSLASSIRLNRVGTRIRVKTTKRQQKGHPLIVAWQQPASQSEEASRSDGLSEDRLVHSRAVEPGADAASRFMGMAGWPRLLPHSDQCHR